MSEVVRYGDGVTIELASGETVVADASTPDADVAVVSHAHADHLYRTPPDAAVWSALTRDLAAVRRDDDVLPERVSHPRIDLFDAGHVPGSRAALIEGDRRYLYTGDVCTRDRLHLEGFDPPSADVLIVESTYGRPAYRFPPVDEVVAAIREWLAATVDRPAILFGYSLGRAQEIQRILAGADRERIFVDPTIAAVSEVVEAHLDVALPGREFDDEVELGSGDALVLPGRRRGGSVEALIDGGEAVTAGLSGWAIDEGFRYGRDLDASFVLSDHCDFPELCELVTTVDPETVYTLHGSAEALAEHLTRELGYDATALKRDQHRLSEF